MSNLEQVFEFNSQSCPDFQDGECVFEVIGAKIGNSKSSGESMMTLNVKLTDANSTSEVTDEHIVEKTLWKLKNLLKGAGRSEMFTQEIKPKLKDYIGLKGKCKTKLEQVGGFPAKHVISNYMISDTSKSIIQSEAPVIPAEPFIDDALPF